MKKIFGTGVALALMAGTAFAADLPVKAPYLKAAPSPVWDIAIGGAIASDYNFRGVSQSNKHASGSAYFELQLNTAIGQLYQGIGALAIDLQTGTEFDVYGGVRKTWGNFALDLGYIWYWYPKEKPAYGFTTGADTNFWEVYAKAAYNITPDLTVGAQVFYSPDVLALGAAAGLGGLQGVYFEGSLKYVLPWSSPTAYGPLGAYVSGAVGHWALDQDGVNFGGADASYTYWNAGIAFTLSALTLDLRYHDTDLSPAECVAFTGFGNSASRWCSGTFIAKLSFDTLLSKIKN